MAERIPEGGKRFTLDNFPGNVRKGVRPGTHRIDISLDIEEGDSLGFVVAKFAGHDNVTVYELVPDGFGNLVRGKPLN